VSHVYKLRRSPIEGYLKCYVQNHSQHYLAHVTSNLQRARASSPVRKHQHPTALCPQSWEQPACWSLMLLWREVLFPRAHGTAGAQPLPVLPPAGPGCQPTHCSSPQAPELC